MEQNAPSFLTREMATAVFRVCFLGYKRYEELECLDMGWRRLKRLAKRYSESIELPPQKPLTTGDAESLTVKSSFTGTFVPAHSSYDQAERLGELNFESLVESYYGPLFRFAMSLTRTENDAADLVQETFLAWGTKGHQLRDRTKVKAWLFTTLHRRFLESQRRATRFPHFGVEEVVEDLPYLEPVHVDQLDAQTIVQMLAKVDEQFQAAVSLFYLEDYSYNEIASILEVPLGTVKSRIARGLGQLRALVLEHSTKKPKEEQS